MAHPELDDILLDFVMTGHPTGEELAAKVRDYPQFERDLVDFVSAWSWLGQTYTVELLTRYINEKRPIARDRALVALH